MWIKVNSENFHLQLANLEEVLSFELNFGTRFILIFHFTFFFFFITVNMNLL